MIIFFNNDVIIFAKKIRNRYKFIIKKKLGEEMKISKIEILLNIMI